MKKKIILLALGMVFLTNCGDNVAVKPENRESFIENPCLRKMRETKDEQDKIILQQLRELECNTLSEAIVKKYNEDTSKKILDIQAEKIKEIEKLTKSKFCFYNYTFHFTPIDTSAVKGRIGKVYILSPTEMGVMYSNDLQLNVFKGQIYEINRRIFASFKYCGRT